jgi:hypothetical protein
MTAAADLLFDVLTGVLFVVALVGLVSSAAVGIKH